MKDKGLIGLASGFETFNHGLTVLNISNCGIGVNWGFRKLKSQERGIVALMRCFESNSILSHSLIQINISHNNIGAKGTSSIATWIQSMDPQVTYIP